MRAKHTVLLGLLGLFVMAFIAACGGDDPTPTSPPAATPTPTTAAVAAAPTPTSAPDTGTGPSTGGTTAPTPTPQVNKVDFLSASGEYLGQTGWQNDPRLADLITAANAEGKLIYYSHSATWAPRACEKFSEMFPAIECTGIGLGVQGISSGFIQEREAGVETADVIGASMTLLATIQGRGYLQDIDWTAEYGVPEGRCLINGNYCIRTFNWYTHWYNTDLVPDVSELPTEYNDFLDPKWKDEIVASNFLYYQGLGYYCVVTSMEQCLTLAEGLENDQNILITSGQNDVIINGEKKICFLCAAFPVRQRDHEDLPVWAWMTDYVGNVPFPEGVTDICENCNAARLFVLWELSTDGSYASHTNNPLECECDIGWPGYGHYPEVGLAAMADPTFTPIIQWAGLTAVKDDTLEPPFYAFTDLAAGGVAFRNARLGQN